MVFRLMIIATFIMVVVLDASKFGQSMKPEAGKYNQSMSIKLATEYKNSKLEDISSDGKRLLLFSTNTWIRSYTFPLDGKPPFANQASKNNDDVLRVVDFPSGREISSVDVLPFPYSPQFIPHSYVVFYDESAKPNQRVNRVIQKVWEPDSNKVTDCFDSANLSLKSEEGGLSSLFVLTSATTALGEIWQRKFPAGDILVKLSLPDCTITRVGPVSPIDLAARLSGLGGSYLSLNAEHVALSTREQKIVIRNAQTLEFVKGILPPSGLRLGEQIKYTPDGKYLLAVTSNTIMDRSDTKRYLLFFDAKNYELVRQLDITKWSPPNIEKDVAHDSNYVGTAMAISPDSSLMAIGFTRIQKSSFSTMEQAEVVLFDLKTGAEVAKARHPAIKQKREDPFAARIGKLIFTPDGKYLLSTTHDTLVWELKR